MNFKHTFLLLIFFSLFLSCDKTDEVCCAIPTTKTLEIRGVDMSLLPEVRQSGLLIKNENNQAEDMLQTLKNAGVNVIRLRLWKNPSANDAVSGFESVKTVSNELKNKGFKVMLTVHYSDWWADPGSQVKPAQWQGISFNQLKDSVFIYTKKICDEINPQYIQIGNEINNGFIYPEGSYNNQNQFKQLLNAGASAVRASNSSTKIIIHYAGVDGAESFFNYIQGVDFDIIGISYYPQWHGKNLSIVQTQLTSISNTVNKPIFIAETSYPFTLGWNDYTNNVLGLSNQILPEFEPTTTGQKQFLEAIKTITKNVPKAIGFCYWGAEWISYKGNTATNGSPWENQALWDFQNKAVPAIQVFGE